MRALDRWVILDTETTGIRNPIYPVEIAAQVMRAWEPAGEPFRVLLNFDVPIDPIAEKMHGYSREYLKQEGLRPSEALAMFLSYAGYSPIVAYNLTYDWNRVLGPTFERIGTRTGLRPGFCALNLTRHVVPALPDFKLQTVTKIFGLAKEQIHHADDDVRLVVQFLSQHVAPHLIKSNVVGFEQVAACADGSISVPPLNPPTLTKKEPKRRTAIDEETMFAIGELVGICRIITLDKHVTADERNFLANWLERCPHAGVQPISGMFDLVREIVADGQVTDQEQQRLIQAIEELLASRKQRLPGAAGFVRRRDRFFEGL